MRLKEPWKCSAADLLSAVRNLSLAFTIESISSRLLISLQKLKTAFLLLTAETALRDMFHCARALKEMLMLELEFSSFLPKYTSCDSAWGGQTEPPRHGEFAHVWSPAERRPQAGLTSKYLTQAAMLRLRAARKTENSNPLSRTHTHTPACSVNAHLYNFSYKYFKSNELFFFY